MPSDSTLKQYAMRLNRLAEGGVDPRDAEALARWFDAEKLGASSRKVYLSAIKNANPDSFPRSLQRMLNELYEDQNKKDMEQKLTEKQTESFMPWEEILKVSPTNLKHKLIVSLYTLNAPVRADYGEMRVFPRRDSKRTGNELIWNSKPVFVFRVYKTAKTYGEVEIPVSAALKRVIGEWFEHLGSTPEYLLGGSAVSPNTFGVSVQDIFKKHTGKPVGVSLLRHAYITHVYPSLKTLKQKEAVAKSMLHSRELQEKYRVVE